jgi:mannose-6-phosphate isomerase
VEDLLVPVPVRKGMSVYIPGGRLHAVCEGCLLLEIQQASNTTYRVYDWGRAGHDGRPRELHLEQALQVIRWQDNAPAAVEPRRLDTPGPNVCSELMQSPHFRAFRLDLTEPEHTLNDGTSFHVLFMVEGRAEVRAAVGAESIDPGASCLMPAALGAYELAPVGGAASVIRIVGA